jgi:hypothetical protein
MENDKESERWNCKGEGTIPCDCHMLQKFCPIRLKEAFDAMELADYTLELVTKEKLKKNHRELALKWHPDKETDPVKKAQKGVKMALINRNYDFLCWWLKKESKSNLSTLFDEPSPDEMIKKNSKISLRFK